SIPWIVAMLAWFRAASDLASRSSRARCPGSPDRAFGKTLIATSRPSLESWARHTSPIPPAPSGERISYGPRRVPAPIPNHQALIAHSLRGQSDAAHQVSVPRVGTEGVDLRVGLHPGDAIGPGVHGPLELPEGRLLFPEADVDRRDLVWADVPFALPL